MDPHAHQLSKMDPKLKAAYESVMNTPATPVSPETPKIQSSEIGATNTVTTTTTTTQPKMVIEEQPESAPKQASDHVVFTGTGKQQQAGTVHIGYSAKPGHKLVLEKNKLGIPPALYIVGCVLFFLLYSLFWVKVFGVSIPFLP